MTTRKELLGHVRAAICDNLSIDNRDGDQMFEGAVDATELAFAAIEAVYKAIGDHQLALLIGDTGHEPGLPRSVRIVDEPSSKIELLQDDDEDDEP
jgi:hypothetical protein